MGGKNVDIIRKKDEVCAPPTSIARAGGKDTEGGKVGGVGGGESYPSRRSRRGAPWSVVNACTSFARGGKGFLENANTRKMVSFSRPGFFVERKRVKGEKRR